MAQLTPMMQQYLEVKERCKDSILFFRLGDFYEMFFEDAKVASRELELVLTGRDCGLKDRAPMCGIPYHAADSYISKLIEKGYKVAICEQIEDPAEATGIVKRDIIKIVTPGTITNVDMLDENKNNYIMSIYKNGEWYALAYCDISTGEFNTTEIVHSGIKGLIDEIARLDPSEIIYNHEFSKNQDKIKYITSRFNVSMSEYDSKYFNYNESINKLYKQFPNLGKKLSITSAVCASGALLSYIEETQKTDFSHINTLNIYSSGDFMTFDMSTRANLELTETMRNKSKKGSLLYVLDKTITAMGARTLRKWIEEPLISKDSIKERLDAVGELIENVYVSETLKENLKNIYDIERLIGKIVYGNVNARDLISLKQSISSFPYVKECLNTCSSSMIVKLRDSIDTLDDVYDLIDRSIIDDPPMSVKDGLIIKDGYNSEVDKLRTASKEGKNWLVNLENKEKEETGIRSLKVGYNKVFGYYIEVTKSNLNLVPEDRYIRKQTLVNAERYITPELKEMESTILGAEEKVVSIEYKIFCDIRSAISKEIQRMQRTSMAISNIDALLSLSIAASLYDYVKPNISDDGIINIKNGRHPVVERMLPNNTFVPNDTYLDKDDNRVAIITGPNMAGKSTYMRQVALLVLMAQIGSFIPADSADIGTVDRIFTRIGASDDLSGGQSTFMVEMSEVANIVNNATSDSLILLDEVGRGTSTFDGLSIAWSVIEYISNKENIGAKTLFATHYHELTELEGTIDGIKNYCISVKEHGDDIIFLRKIIRGGADQSYGIQVAKLAGLPNGIIDRAKEILSTIEKNDLTKKKDVDNEVVAESPKQLDFFSMENLNIINELKNIDILNMTPMESLNFLYKLVKEVNKY